MERAKGEVLRRTVLHRPRLSVGGVDACGQVGDGHGLVRHCRRRGGQRPRRRRWEEEVQVVFSSARGVRVNVILTRWLSPGRSVNVDGVTTVRMPPSPLRANE